MLLRVSISCSTYLYPRKGSSHICHHSPETAIHEMGILCSFPPPVLPQPGWHPGEDSRHPPHVPSCSGPGTRPPAHLRRSITVGWNVSGMSCTFGIHNEVMTARVNFNGYFNSMNRNALYSYYFWDIPKHLGKFSFKCINTHYLPLEKNKKLADGDVSPRLLC